MKNSNSSSPQRRVLQTTTEKTLDLLRKDFASLVGPEDASQNSLLTLHKYTNRLAFERGITLNDAPEKLDRDHLMIFAFLTLANAQARILENSPQINQTNRLAIANFATAFGVPETNDSDSLLQSISVRFNLPEYNNIGEEITKRLLCMPKLIKKFGLNKKDPELLFNPDKLASSIRRKCENTPFVGRLTELLDLPNETSDDMILNYVKKKCEVKDQTEEIIKLKKQNRELRDRLNNEGKMQQNGAEKAILRENDLRSAEKDLAERKTTVLQIRIQGLEVECEKLKEHISNLEKESSNAADNSTIAKANKLLEKQFRDQFEELKNGSDNRRGLIRMIQKQAQLLTVYDKMINISPLGVPVQDYQLRAITSPPIDTKIYGVICDSIENAPSDIIDAILKILNDNRSTKQEKVRAVINYFIEHIRKQRQIIDNKAGKGSLDRLTNAMHSQLHFLENLIHCEDDIQFLFSDPDEAKKSLQHQAALIHTFLSQSAKGFVEDANIFDSMQLNVDPLEISDKLTDFIERYPVVQTEEGEELFVLLRQSFAVNSILRRFAITTRNQCEKQSTDLRSLMSEFKRIQEARATTIANLQQQLEAETSRRSKSESNVKKLKTLIKMNAAAQQQQQQQQQQQLQQQQQREENISKSGSSLSKSEVDESEVNELKERLSSTMSELEKANNELSIVKASGASNKEDEAKITSLNSEIQNLNGQIATSKEDNEKLKKKIDVVKNKYRQKVEKLSRDFENLKQQTENIQKNEQSEYQLEKKKSELLKQKINKLKLKNQNNQDRIADLAEKYKSTENMRNKLQNDIQNETENNKLLDEQLKVAQTKILSNEFEDKIMQQKIKSLQNEIERERQSFESILSLHKTTSQSEVENHIERIREEFARSQQSLLSNISTEFSTYVDFTRPIDEENVMNTVRTVKEKLIDLLRQKSNHKRQLEDIRTAFGLQNHADIVAFANDTKRKIEETTKLIQNLQKQISALENSTAMKNGKIANSWEDWARQLYMSFAENTSNVASTTVIRKGIEEVVLYSGLNHDNINYKNRNNRQIGIVNEKRVITDGIDSIRPIIVDINAINRMQSPKKESSKKIVQTDEQEDSSFDEYVPIFSNIANE